MQILVIDCNITPSCWGAADLVRFAAGFADATVTVRRAPHDDLPANIYTYDRILISGSLTAALDEAPWISHLDQAIVGMVERKQHVLGVCYGHQSIVRAVGGRNRVRRSKNPEYGWAKIEQVTEASLFRGLPKTFHSFQAHFDEVVDLPRGFKLLAKSELCAIQAFQIVGQPIYGIQFHPEKNLADGTRSLKERQKLGEPKVLLNPDAGGKFFNPSIGETLFRNFINGTVLT